MCLVFCSRRPSQASGSGLRPARAQHFLCAPSREQMLVPVGAAYSDDCAGGSSGLPCFLGQHHRVRCRHAVARASLVREDGFEPPWPLRAGGLQPPAFIRSAIHAASCFAKPLGRHDLKHRARLERATFAVEARCSIQLS